VSVASQEPREIPSLWRPLRVPTLRNLLVADVASDVGTFMESVGAAWMMVSVHAGPLYVALTQTASALPFFVLALPAGALGDIVDPRKLILFTESWMACVAIALTSMTLAGRLSPIPDLDVCTLCRRCPRKPDLARRFARTGLERRPRIGGGTQRHRIQLWQGHRTRERLLHPSKYYCGLRTN
jgi:hypothetical protein